MILMCYVSQKDNFLKHLPHDHVITYDHMTWSHDPPDSSDGMSQLMQYATNK